MKNKHGWGVSWVFRYCGTPHSEELNVEFKTRQEVRDYWKRVKKLCKRRKQALTVKHQMLRKLVMKLNESTMVRYQPTR